MSLPEKHYFVRLDARTPNACAKCPLLRWNKVHTIAWSEGPRQYKDQDDDRSDHERHP